MPFISAFNGSFYIRLLQSAASVPEFGTLANTVQWDTIKGSVESTVDPWGFYPVGFTFNNDGTKAYFTTRSWQTGTANDASGTQVSIAQYTLSSPYDMATATYDSINNTVIPGLMSVKDMLWNTDGTKAFLCIAYENTYTPLSNRYQLWECSSTIPYDVSGIQISSPTNTIVTSDEILSISWNNDGTKIFAASDQSGIFTATLPTAYSLSGATTSFISSTTIGLGSIRIWGLSFSNDGLTAFISQSQTAPNDQFYKLTLSSAYDLSSSTLTENIAFGLAYPYDIEFINYQGTSYQNIVFGSFDGSRSFRYYESGLPAPAPIVEATMINRAYIDTSDSSVEYDYYLGNIRILDNGTKVLYSGSYNDGSSHRDMRIATLNTPYDISSSTTATSVFEPSTFASTPYNQIVNNPRDFWISNDGLTLYVMYGDWATNQIYWAREIYKFTLSTAWDLSTVTDWTPTQTFAIASTSTAEQAAGMGTSDHIPSSFWFNNDGTKLFIFTADSNALADDHLLEYPLSTPYDLTSAGTRTWHKFIDTSDPLNQLQSGDSFVPNSIEFNDDGTKLFGIFSKSGFIVGVTTWTLGTAWDISTLTKDSWEQDISAAYTDDSGTPYGATSRGSQPTAFVNDNLYIADVLHTSAGGLNTSPIYRWDFSSVDFSAGNRAFYSYSITNDTQSNTVDEGQSVVFTISAPDIPDGSTVYWEVDPYSSTELEDFDTATRSGTATFTNGTTTITVNVLNDILDETSQNERFNLRLAKNENYYSEFFPLLSSNLISIGEVPWISLDHTIQTAGLVTNDRLGQGKMSNGMNSTYTVISSYNKADGANANSGEVYLYNTSTGALERTFTNPNAYNTTANDFFGYSVGLSDSYLIVGAIFEDSAGGNSSGKAYVFNLSDGSLKYTLNNPNTYGTEESDHFGNAVAITDDYAIVGAYYEDSGTFGQETGAAYIFDMSDGSLAATLNNPDEEPGTLDWFGYSVSINQNFAVVGAPKESFDTSQVNTGGKVYLYRLSSSGWVFYRSIDNPGTSGATYHANDQFGWDVKLTGKHLVVSANGATDVDDSGTNTYSGRVDVFNIRDGAYLYSLGNPAFGGVNDYFGDTVDASDNFVIVGTQDLDSTNNGGAYIYNINSGSYMTTLNNPNTYSGPDGDRFGSTVAISDNGTAAVSAAFEDTASTTDSGALYIYNSVYTLPTGEYTYKGIGDRGLIWGGVTATNSSKIQYFDITTLGDAAEFGTRTTAGGYAASMSDSVRGIWAGGSTQRNASQGGVNSYIDYVTISILGNASAWSSALSATGWSAGVSDGDRGVFFGGPESFVDATTFMNYISMSVESYQAFDFGNLALAAGEVAGAGDATYGIKAGGFYDDSNKYRRAQMERFTIQTTSSAAYIGNLTQARRKLTGTSNGTLGLFAGGIDSSNDLSRLNIIDYLTIATDSSATDFGDLIEATQGVSACSNESRAVFGGGVSSSGTISILQHVSYNTPGNSSTFGNLISGTWEEGGTGLSGGAA